MMTELLHMPVFMPFFAWHSGKSFTQRLCTSNLGPLFWYFENEILFPFRPFHTETHKNEDDAIHF